MSIKHSEDNRRTLYSALLALPLYLNICQILIIIAQLNRFYSLRAFLLPFLYPILFLTSERDASIGDSSIEMILLLFI